MDWQLFFTALGIVATIVFSSIALFRTFRQNRIDSAGENLTEIFDGNQKLIENISKDNEALRKRLTDLELKFAEDSHAKQEEIDRLTAERNELGHKLLKSQANEAKLIKQLEGV